MPRILLIHWNADEAEVRAATLRKAGHSVETLTDAKDSSAHKRIAANPPDLFIIDLARLPSHGRELGGWLRRNRATRHVPLLYIEGDPVKTDRVRALLPDAHFAPWTRVRAAVTRALKTAPKNPVVPGAMDGYTQSPLPKKLGLKPDTPFTLLGAQRDFDAQPPPGATAKRRAGKPTPVVLLFVKSAAELDRRWPTATNATADPGRLWICWPKRASGIASDLTQSVVRAHGLSRDWVDFKIAAIDEVWTGLAFTRRKERS